MPGLINAHRYPIRKNAKFIRLRHTGVSLGSLFLSDLDTPENKSSNAKIPVYIPYKDTVDILLTDRVLTSYQQGSIRGFLDDGLLESFIVQSIEVDEGVEQFLPAYDIQIDDDLITVDSSSGDVLVNLPDIFSEPAPQERTPQGTRITVKKTSLDANSIIISAAVGNTIEGTAAPYALTSALSSITLQSDELGNWWAVSAAGNQNVNASPLVVTFSQDLRVPESVGMLFLKAGTVVTSAAPWVATTSLQGVAGSISVNTLDPQTYNVEVLINNIVEDVLSLGSNQLQAVAPLSFTLNTGDQLALRVHRTSGSQKSTFCNILVNLQLSDL